MIKKIICKAKGFTPLELLLVVGISAVVAGLFIFAANKPQQMAQLPPINVNVAAQPSRTPNRYTVTMASDECTVTVDGAAQEDDAGEVQAKVNENPGGTVCLTGTFDFGTEGSVNINNDVEIRGETDSQGIPLTVINGGSPFVALLPAILPSPLPPGPKVTIQGIHFDGTVGTSIYLEYISDADVVGNKFNNFVPSLPPGGPFPTIPNVGAIIIGPFLQGFVYGATTGSINIKDNWMDMAVPSPAATMGDGIASFFTTNAMISVTENTVLNAPRTAIETINHYVDEGAEGMIFIRNNDIITPTAGIPIPMPNAPNGILLGLWPPQGPPPYGMPPYGMTSTKYVVEHNDIELRGFEFNRGGFGIGLMDNDAIIKGNNIVAADVDPSTRVILVMGGGNLVSNNKIEGSGLCAFFLYQIFPFMPVNNNVFLGNNTDNFSGLTALIWWEAKDNIFVGGGGMAAPLGPYIDPSNVFKGEYNVGDTPEGVGDAVSEEMSSWQNPKREL